MPTVDDSRPYPAKQTTPSAPCRLRTVITVDWSARQEARIGCIYVTIYWTSDDCDGQVILTLHLSVGQVILFPYFDHWILSWIWQLSTPSLSNYWVLPCYPIVSNLLIWKMYKFFSIHKKTVLYRDIPLTGSSYSQCYLFLHLNHKNVRFPEATDKHNSSRPMIIAHYVHCSQLNRQSLVNILQNHIVVISSFGVRKLQVAILAQSSRDVSLTVRIVWQYILSRVRVSVLA